MSRRSLTKYRHEIEFQVRFWTYKIEPCLKLSKSTVDRPGHRTSGKNLHGNSSTVRDKRCSKSSDTISRPYFFFHPAVLLLDDTKSTSIREQYTWMAEKIGWVVTYIIYRSIDTYKIMHSRSFKMSVDLLVVRTSTLYRSFPIFLLEVVT